MKFFRLFFAATSLSLAAFTPTMTYADDLAPDVLVKNVTNEVLEIVRKDKDIQSGSIRKAVDLVEVKVLPHFDFTRMTQLAVARDWRNANPTQQKSLVDEFRALLVRTYSKALTEYKNQTITFKPLVMKPADTTVVVKTLIKQSSGGQPIDMNYELEKSGMAWKVVDIQVGGVSLITNYRDSFATEVRNSGVDGLIKMLQTKNKAGETPASAAARK
jgi:phospholipid transport system substrate-binding protein